MLYYFCRQNDVLRFLEWHMNFYDLVFREKIYFILVEKYSIDPLTDQKHTRQACNDKPQREKGSDHMNDEKCQVFIHKFEQIVGKSNVFHFALLWSHSFDQSLAEPVSYGFPVIGYDKPVLIFAIFYISQFDINRDGFEFF